MSRTAFQLTRERVKLVEGAAVIVELPGAARAAVDRRPVALGRAVDHVSLLVADAPLDRGALPEQGSDSGPERLAAVDHDQHALLDIEHALGEVGQKGGSDRLILGRASHKPGGIFTPSGVIPSATTQQRP